MRTDTDLNGLLSVSDSWSGGVRWTNRFLLGVVESLRVRLNNFAVNLVCPAAVISEASSAHTDIDLGHAERFAIVQRFNGSKEVEILFEQVCELHEISSSLLCGDVPPGCLEGLTGDRDSVIDIFFCGFVDLTDWFLGGGVDGLESLAILAFDKLVINKAAITGVSVRCERFGGGGEISWDQVRGKADDGAGVAVASSALRCGEDSEGEGETHSPVGCSNLPAAGVSRVAERDMLGMGLCEVVIVVVSSYSSSSSSTRTMQMLVKY